MGHLSGLAAGQGMHQSWEDGRGSKGFKEVVAAAGGMMDASHFGAAAALGGIGPMLEKPLRKAHKASQHHVLLQMFIDSGMTEAEAVGRLQAPKEQRRAEERRKMERQTPANHD